MDTPISELLHPRILTHCEKLFDDGHFKHAAREAMIQVELALKEKAGVKEKYGVNLVSALFGNAKGVTLRVPFGDELQDKAQQWFRGAFAYYRNYLAHDGSKVDKQSSARILITASELLELIGASSKSFADIGGVPGLIKQGIFRNEDDVKSLLLTIHNYTLPDHVCDGFYEDLASRRFGRDEVVSLIELGLVEYKSKEYIATEEELRVNPFPPEEIGWFELTEVGKSVLAIQESTR